MKTMPDDKSDSIDNYIKSKPKEVQDKLIEMRQIIKSALPSSNEAIKWGEPATLALIEIVDSFDTTQDAYALD